MYITTPFGTTGLSSTITIYNLADSSVVVNGAAMTEMGTTGVYKYDFTAYFTSIDYLYVSDGGAALGDSRYQYSVELNIAQWVVTAYGTTGLSATVTILDMLDDSTAVSSTAMTEVASTGVYKYNFTAYSSNKDYLYISDGGVALGDDRYSYGHNVKTTNETTPLTPPASGIRRYPHTGTLCVVAVGTGNTIGDYVAGALTTLYHYCDVQPNSTQRMITGFDGQSVMYNFKVFLPLLNTVFTNNQDLYFRTGGESYQVLDVVNMTNVKQTRIII